MEIRNATDMVLLISAGGNPRRMIRVEEPDVWKTIPARTTIEVDAGFLDFPYVQIEVQK